MDYRDSVQISMQSRYRIVFLWDTGAVRGEIQTEFPSVWWIDACIDILGADDTREQIMDYTVVHLDYASVLGTAFEWMGLNVCTARCRLTGLT